MSDDPVAHRRAYWLADDSAHTAYGRLVHGTSECATWYLDSETHRPYPCSCGYVAAIERGEYDDRVRTQPRYKAEIPWSSGR